MKTSVWEKYRMARKSPTNLNRSICGPRDDTGFDPFIEVCKIVDFAEASGRQSPDVFTVFVKNGNVEWTVNRLDKKHPGFIAVIDRVKFAAGITNSAWHELEEKIAKEMCKQRKAW